MMYLALLRKSRMIVAGTLNDDINSKMSELKDIWTKEKDAIHELKSIKTQIEELRRQSELAQQQGAFTIFALVDALTKLSQRTVYAGDRTELDTRIGQLLALAA